jgi:HTH-type transcriptional regulator/antitoxin HigA
MSAKHEPIRYAVAPGELIREELETRAWTQGELAAKLGRPYQAVNAIVNGHKAITADTAIELGEAFGTSAVYWLNLQSAYQLYLAHQRKRGRVNVPAKKAVRAAVTSGKKQTIR